VLENLPSKTAQEIAGALKDSVTQYLQQLEERFGVELEEAAVAAAQKSRRAASEELNQVLRRLRQCVTTEEIAAWLVDSSSAYCSRAALFEASATKLRGIRCRGFEIDAARFEEFEVPLTLAPAIAHAISEQDTVVAIGSAAEVSAAVVEALGHAPDEKIYLYPVVIEGRTAAVLYATAGRPFVDGAALELLAQAAADAARILTLERAPVAVTRPGQAENSPHAQFVQIEGAAAPKADMRQLAREARARMYARAAVARMRLKRGDAVERGRTGSNLYASLKPEIEAARITYRQDFLEVSPVIADYLHKELLGLAHEDANLLGPEYPGALA
jgi:hypothetical protein